MQTDVALELLLPWLQNPREPTLWIADENALSILDAIQPNPKLTLVTNRYDIANIAKNKNINSIFSDFNSNEYYNSDYQSEKFSIVVYRISKEKAVVNHIIEQACTLAPKGKLILSGFKQDGIKSYGDKLKKTGISKDKLQKKGPAYLGAFQLQNTNSKIKLKHSSEPYHTLQKINCEQLTTNYFYSKPGVFGWNKIDKGTDLLLAEASALLSAENTKDKTALDLGCGYGWIFLNLDNLGFNTITATDNNAAALISAKENAKRITTPITIIASDCANTLDKQFDFIFCNPPFHQGFKHSQDLTQKFIEACKKKLKKKGKALFVLNEFVAIDRLLEIAHLKQELLSKQSGFKVILIEHQ